MIAIISSLNIFLQPRCISRRDLTTLFLDTTKDFSTRISRRIISGNPILQRLGLNPRKSNLSKITNVYHTSCKRDLPPPYFTQMISCSYICGIWWRESLSRTSDESCWFLLHLNPVYGDDGASHALKTLSCNVGLLDYVLPGLGEERPVQSAWKELALSDRDRIRGSQGTPRRRGMKQIDAEAAWGCYSTC